MATEAGEKRTAGGGSTALVEKKQKTSGAGTTLATVSGGGSGAIQVAGPQRTSELLAPIMLLTGHDAPVLTGKFSPDGRHMLTGSQDRLMLLWEVFGECKNLLTFRGHQNAVLEVHWSADGEQVYSASADKTVLLWDAQSGSRVRGYKGHTALVNSCCPSGNHALASGSDDCTARLWDDRVRTCQRVIRQPFPCTAVSVSDDGTQVLAPPHPHTHIGACTLLLLLMLTSTRRYAALHGEPRRHRARLRPAQGRRRAVDGARWAPGHRERAAALARR